MSSAILLSRSSRGSKYGVVAAGVVAPRLSRNICTLCRKKSTDLLRVFLFVIFAFLRKKKDNYFLVENVKCLVVEL